MKTQGGGCLGAGCGAVLGVMVTAFVFGPRTTVTLLVAGTLICAVLGALNGDRFFEWFGRR